jgi:Protein kinase domain
MSTALRRWLAGVAFGSALSSALCLIPPHEPVERDPLVLLLVGSVAAVASGALMSVLDDRGLRAVTLVLLSAALAVGSYAALVGSDTPSGGSAMLCFTLCVVASACVITSVGWRSARWHLTLTHRLGRRGTPVQRRTARSATDPTWIGDYRILRRLGEGGMGTVWLGRACDGRLVAIKTIRSVLADDPSFLARFRREVEAARRVPRACTAPVVDADLDAPTPYLVTEYVAGLTLEQAVATGGPLPPSRLDGVAAGIAAALTAIHGAGVVHRDLKPANILLPPGGVVVVDFGIARQLDATASLSGAHDWRGTPSFMAPEQFTSDLVTPATDVFAWGGVVTFAGIGRPPFRASSVAELRDRIVGGAPELHGLDPAIRPLVEQALRKDPTKRPSASDLLRQLQPR